MTSDDVHKVHQKFCASSATPEQRSFEGDDIGSRILLEEAIQELKGHPPLFKADPRTATLKEQLAKYKDRRVSPLNLISAKNQVEVVMAGKWCGPLYLRHKSLSFSTG
jgi:hypothetical protein